MKLFSAPKATERQIRTHYKAGGYEVRISEEHVRFRPANRSKRDTGGWRDVDGQVVLI